MKYIFDEFGVEYSLNGVYVLLHSAGMSWVSSRSSHPMQDKESQENFKKNF